MLRSRFPVGSSRYGMTLVFAPGDLYHDQNMTLLDRKRPPTEVGGMLLHLAVIIVQDVDVAKYCVDIPGESITNGAKLFNRIQGISFMRQSTRRYTLTKNGR